MRLDWEFLVKYGFVLNLILILLVLMFTSGYSVGILYGNSMEPTIGSCSLTVYDTNEPASYDDVVRFEHPHSDITYTHRVVGFEDNGQQLVIKGDNRTEYDPLVHRDAVTGVLIWHSPSVC